MVDNGTISAVAEIPTVAKKKSVKPRSKQRIILTYKADEDRVELVTEWLEGLASHVGAPVTVTVDMALKAFAEARKYPEPMPKRLAR